MVLGCVQSASLKDHTRYLGGRKRLPPPSTDQTDKGGHNVRGPTKGCSETVGLGSVEEHMDLGDNLETCRRESLCAPRSSEISGSNPEVGPRHKGEPEGRQETADRGGGGSGRGTVGVGLPSAPGGLAPDQGMV